MHARGAGIRTPVRYRHRAGLDQLKPVEQLPYLRAAIEFTGHGYKGTIGAMSNLPSAAPSFAGVNGKNFTGITLTRQ